MTNKKITLEKVAEILEDTLIDINCPGFGDHTDECHLMTKLKKIVIKKLENA